MYVVGTFCATCTATGYPSCFLVSKQNQKPRISAERVDSYNIIIIMITITMIINIMITITVNLQLKAEGERRSTEFIRGNRVLVSENTNVA